LVHQLATQGAILDGFYYCPHHPEASVPAYKKDCECRKPNPGMFLRAAEDWNIDLGRSFMVGDMPRDMEAARAAGVEAILVNQRRDELPGSVAVAANLLEAASAILAHATPGEAARPINTISPLRPV
jgi:D-glycero-D-manno-heptose 1,7-bisphosphate phosphatase